ncbi:hypothetical protein D5S17_34505 [Pseudonocardiaceae bacterium YIM PH 21723]|nr:hypothetical protein D5S17_34505 [Pseudonocardiaceae bacterium YIM PH 21723]
MATHSFGRRPLLQGLLATGGLAMLPAGVAAAPVAFPDWARFARLADATFDEDADPVRDMQPKIDALRKQNVSVIELDTILTNWITEAQFTQHMTKVKQFCELAHQAGMRVVMYYPSLEVISIGGEKGPSFYKNSDGAKWVQRSPDGKPNVFYGSLVVWVDPGDESCWVSPDSPWRDFYFGRIKALAAAGVDGVWPDVPIYFQGALPWCDASSWAKAAFKADTGLEIPSTVDFKNPAFRSYVEWRHRTLARWQRDIAAAGRSVNPEMVTFVETVTMDYMYGTQIGLDGGYLRAEPTVSQVWEVDILGNYDGMRHATATDWTCLISMYKYARAASGGKPAWAFSYGWKADDASHVMAELLAAGCNPYEVKSPYKSDSTDIAMRTRMYRWVAANQDKLFGSRSLGQVGVYHSSASRDFVDPTEGAGMYANAAVPPDVTAPEDGDPWWSSGSAQESCVNQPWVGEFRGTVKALVYAQIPFDTVTSPGLTAADLTGYRALLLPNLQAVSDAEAAMLRNFVSGGGTIVLTGPAPTGLDQLGSSRADFALADVLGLHRTDALPASKKNAFGQGTCWYFKDLLGKSFLGNQSTSDQLLAPVRAAAPAFVTVTGDRRIHLEARQLGQDTVLHLVNFTNFGDTPAPYRAASTSCTVWLAVPAGKQVAAVTVSSPDATSPDPQPVPYTPRDGGVAFTPTVAQYSLFTVTVR